MKGTEFRDARKSLKLSQEELGELFGVNKRTIWLQEKSDTVGPLYAHAISYLLIRDKSRKLAKELAVLC